MKIFNTYKAFKIIENLDGRRGFDFSEIDDDIFEGIIEEISQIISNNDEKIETINKNIKCPICNNITYNKYSICYDCE